MNDLIFGKMSKQILSVEQMQHLKELGLELKRRTIYGSRHEQPTDPAYNLQDILDVLPKSIHNIYDYYLNLAVNSEKLWCASYDNYDIGSTLEYIDDESPIDAAYELLCWAVENGYVKTIKKKRKQIRCSFHESCEHISFFISPERASLLWDGKHIENIIVHDETDEVELTVEEEAND